MQREWYADIVNAQMIMPNLRQDGFCPLGPCIVSTEQIPDAAILNLKTRLNGKIMQNGSADDMIFSIPEIVSYVSQVQNSCLFQINITNQVLGPHITARDRHHHRNALWYWHLTEPATVPPTRR